MNNTTNQTDNDEFDLQMIELLRKKAICKNWNDEMFHSYCNALRIYAELICTSESSMTIKPTIQTDKIEYRNAA